MYGVLIGEARRCCIDVITAPGGNGTVRTSTYRFDWRRQEPRCRRNDGAWRPRRRASADELTRITAILGAIGEATTHCIDGITVRRGKNGTPPGLRAPLASYFATTY